MYENAAFYEPQLAKGKKSTVTVACGFSPIKIHYSDYPKRISEVYVFFSIKYRYSDILLNTPKLHYYSNGYCGLFRCNHTCYFDGKVSDPERHVLVHHRSDSTEYWRRQVGQYGSL